MGAASPAAAPFHIMAKPIGPVCNLDCQYCFYLEKEVLWGKGERWKMNGPLLENYVRQYIQAQPGSEVSFAWQGGEPTLLGVPFFEEVVALQQKYGDGKRITNAFQTNGVLLDDRWGRFLRDHDFLVGISLDGPEKIHDAYRKDKAGRGTWARVMRGLEMLQKHEVEFNTLTCVNRLTATKPDLVYRFLRGVGARHMQFIPIVERRADGDAGKIGLKLAAPPNLQMEDDEERRVTPWTVRSLDFGEFLVSIFNRWVRHDVGRIYIQTFEVAFAKWLGISEGGLCYFAEACGQALAMEHNGDVYACDHYVYPQHRRGNINDSPLAELVDSPDQKAFGQDKKDRLPQYCRDCPWLFACNGECPKHRFDRTPDGEPGLNYLCRAYKRFFSHVDPYYRVMAQLHRRGRPAAEVMDLIRLQPALFKGTRAKG